jgi:hypothetical protein
MSTFLAPTGEVAGRAPSTPLRVLAWLCVSGLAGGLSCQSEGAAVPSHTRIAILAVLSGSASVSRGRSSDWSSLASGAELYDEDRIRTFKGARAQLAFTGGSSLRLEEESLVSLGGVGVGVLIERGTVEGELSPGFRVRTPALEAQSSGRGRDIVFQ